MRAQRASTISQCRFAHSDSILHVFGIECPKPDLISCWCWDFITILLSQVGKNFMQNFHHIVENAAYLHYWALSSFALLNEDERIHLLLTGWSSCPYVRTNHGIFIRILQWQTRFHWAMAPTKPGPNPIGFFLWRYLKNKIFATPRPQSKSWSDVLPWKFRTLLRKCCERFFKIWYEALLSVKISMKCIFSICYGL